jgi:hypothetical protein
MPIVASCLFAAGPLLVLILLPYLVGFVGAATWLGLCLGVMAGLVCNSRRVGCGGAGLGGLLGKVFGYFAFVAGLGGGSAQTMEWTWFGGNPNGSVPYACGITFLGLLVVLAASGVRWVKSERTTQVSDIPASEAQGEEKL